MVRNTDWLARIPAGSAIVVMEGVSMYLRTDEQMQTLVEICTHFEKVSLLMDCYTEFAAKASGVKNPINDVGVTQVYGIDDPQMLEANGYENNFSDTRLHHEIYLSDARKVAPEKWKTVIRHPIKKR